MALGKYTRVDGRKSSTGYCSTVTLVVFVGLCLVGVWMMTSSSIVPVQNVEDSSQEDKNEVKTQVSESNENNVSNKDNTSSESIESRPKQFEDNPGDLPEDATKGDSSVSLAQDDNKPEFQPEKTTEHSSDEKISESQPEKITEHSSDENKSEFQPEKTTEHSSDENNSESQPEETTKHSSEENKSESQPEKTTEHPSEENQDENLGKQSGEKESNSESGSKTEMENGEDKKEDGVSKTEDKVSEAGKTKTKGDESNIGGQGDSEEGSNGSKSDSEEGEKKSKEKSGDPKDEDKSEGLIEEKNSKEVSGEKKEVFPSGAQSELLNETVTQNGAFSTQAAESKNKKEENTSPESDKQTGYNWKLCNVTAGSDYIPCLDNLEAIRNLRTTKHYEHRERHCPDDSPTCLVPLPEGYQRPIEWPNSREKIWYHNVPHTKLAEIKGHQNWVKVSGEYLTFPGGGTQFKHGALHYIDFIQQIVPDIAWGKRSRVILDVGCGVASFGGFLFDRDVLTMSFAPKDEHEAQVQFALERGIPALSAVMGTKRLPFPARVFDVVHCARCRVPWHIEGGKLLLELNRLLRPGGFFVWSATPVYQKLNEDVEIWEAMKKLTKQMCWEVISVSKDRVNKVGVAVYQKPSSNECYESRPENEPSLCTNSDDPNAAWNVPLQSCMHKVPVGESERGSKWPEQWPARVDKPPYWLLSSQIGVYGKAAPEDFKTDYEHWKRVVTKSYLSGMGINWSNVRNVMDMRSVYGGFAAALREMNVWVMNVISVDSPDTLPIIYERGLFGMYHDWCESFSTYPRSYDLLHADHLFSKIKMKCNFMAFVAEVDRILRPEGKLIVRDKVDTISELESMFRSMHWEVRMTYSKDKEGLLCVQKSMWRPKESETITYAIS